MTLSYDLSTRSFGRVTDPSPVERTRPTERTNTSRDVVLLISRIPKKVCNGEPRSGRAASPCHAHVGQRSGDVPVGRHLGPGAQIRPLSSSTCVVCVTDSMTPSTLRIPQKVCNGEPISPGVHSSTYLAGLILVHLSAHRFTRFLGDTLGVSPVSQYTKTTQVKLKCTPASEAFMMDAECSPSLSPLTLMAPASVRSN